MCWGSGGIVFHDIVNMAADDDLMADQRVQSARRIFDISAGIPILSPDDEVIGVIMLYRIPTKASMKCGLPC